MFCIESPTTHANIFQNGRLLKVVTPTVEMSCELPLGCAVQRQSCRVRFLRLPISCELTPEDILHDTLIGIGTMLSPQTRRYLHRYDDRSWQVRLGRTWMELYADEVADVCTCLDVIGQRYAQAVREATTRLETWDYPQAEAHGRAGGRLLSLHRSLWRLMQRFASQVQAPAGESNWLCFGNLDDSEAITIAGPGGTVRAILRAMPCEAQQPDDHIALLYEYPDKEFLACESDAEQSWQSGSQAGVWTATCTENWLLNIFIPHVCAHYQTGPLTPCSQAVRLQSRVRRIPWHEIRKPEQFIPYVEGIQRWLAVYPVPLLPAAMLRPYYAAMSAFMESIEPAYDFHSAVHQVRDERREEDCVELAVMEERSSFFSIEEFIIAIRRQVRIINGAAYEHRRCAELLSQIWLPFLEHECTSGDAELLNTMCDAIQPLWEQARFDMRYVIS